MRNVENMMRREFFTEEDTGASMTESRSRESTPKSRNLPSYRFARVSSGVESYLTTTSVPE